MKPLPVIETFGPVIQGEGVMAGQQTHFLRLGGCDYRCSWCDTMYAVKPELVKKNAHYADCGDVGAQLLVMGKKSGVRTLTISGGNPCLHDLTPLVRLLRSEDWYLTVETQGTIFQPWLTELDIVTFSPKPPSSGMNQNLDNFEMVANQVLEAQIPICIKVVVFDKDDLFFAKKVFHRFPDNTKAITKYLQPGTDIDSSYPVLQIINQTKWIIENVIHDSDWSGVRVMPQIHSLVYGQARGV